MSRSESSPRHGSAKPRRSSAEAGGRFDAVTIALHWLTVAAILLMAASGLSFASAEGTPLFAPLLFFHRSLGAALFCTSALRLLWRLTFARFPPFPDKMGAFHRRVVTLSERALYGLLALQPLTGLAVSLLRGAPFPLLAWTVPALLPHEPALAQLAMAAHEYGAYAFFALIYGHAAAALIHHLIVRDDVLAAMAPWLDRKGVSAPAIPRVHDLRARTADRAI